MSSIDIPDPLLTYTTNLDYSTDEATVTVLCMGEVLLEKRFSGDAMRFEDPVEDLAKDLTERLRRVLGLEEPEKPAPTPGSVHYVASAWNLTACGEQARGNADLLSTGVLHNVDCPQCFNWLRSKGML